MRRILFSFIGLVFGVATLPAQSVQITSQQTQQEIIVDESFVFGETNITTVHDIEFFPDGRIAYGGAGQFETIGISGANGEVVNTDSAGFFLTDVASLAVDPIDRVIYSVGQAAQGEFSAWVQKSLGWDDVNWSSFSQVRGRANKILAMPDRTLLIAGRLQVSDSTNTYGLVRLNLTGNLDPAFSYQTSAELEVTAMEIMADGSILAAYQQTNENQLLYGYSRWESNGLTNAPPIPTADSRVSAMVRMPGTNLILLAHEELNEGQIETSFSWADENGAASGPAAEWPKVSGIVHAIAFETITPQTANEAGYDRVIIAGEFSRVGTNDCHNLASLNKDGSVAWCFPTNAGPDAPIRDVEVQLDGKVLIAGAFTNVSGVAANGIARITGSSAGSSPFLFWADSAYAAGERQGEAVLKLKRSGDLNEPLVVDFSADSDPASAGINVPSQAIFQPGESEALAQIGIIDNSQLTGKRTLQITATTTNANVIHTRPVTTFSLLDDETAGTLDPTHQWQLPPFRNTFAIQPDGKVLFSGSGLGLNRLNPDGSIDPTFITNGINAPEGEILQLLPQADGTIYVAGWFNRTNGFGINHVARLNPDGTLDPTFDPRLSRRLGMRWVKVQVLSGGDVLIWLGQGITREAAFGGLMRLDKNGALVWAVTGVSAWGEEPTVEANDSDEFFTYGGSFPIRLTKYEAPGVVSTTFPRLGLAGRLWDLEASGDALYVAGNFTLIGSTAATNLVELDGVTGEVRTNFNPVVNGTVHTVKLHGDKIYISGDFTEVNGQTRFRVARLNPDGSLDPDFNPGFGPNRAPGALAVQVDGSVIIGNGFGCVDGIPADLFVKLEGDARPGEIRLVSSRIEVDATNEFVTVELERVGGSRGPLSTTLSTVEGSALAGAHFANTNITITYLDGEIGRKLVQIPIYPAAQTIGRSTFSILNGEFPNFQETTVLILAHTSPLTATASAAGSTNTFRDIAVDTNGWVYAVGSFTNVNGANVTNLVRLDSNLEVDVSFRPANLPALVLNDTTNEFTPLNTVAVNENGIAIGGLFNLVGENDWASVVKIWNDGTYDEDFNTAARATAANPTIETRHLLYQPDGRLVLSHQGVPSRRLEPDGTLDSSFAGDFRQGGDIWLDSMGRFYALSPIPSAVLRYNTNGLSDSFSIQVGYRVNLSTPPSTLLDSMAIQPDDKILIGGAFTHVGTAFGAPATPRWARVLTNRVVDTNFVAIVGTNTPGSAPKNKVTAIQILPDGNILIGGIFDVVNGERRTMLALLSTNGELRNDFQVEVVGEQINQFALLPDGDVIVRGKVSTVDGVEVGELFKLSIPDMQPPVATFLWPTNGAQVPVSDTQETIQVHAFDPDGFVEQVVLELDGQTVATNHSGNVPFQLLLPASGEHALRMIVTDDSGLTTSETVTFQIADLSPPQTLSISSNAGEVVITYEHGQLLESPDLETWTQVHTGGGEYRTAPSETQRFYRATTP